MLAKNHATSQSPQAYFSNRFDIVYQGDIDIMRYSPDSRLHESSSAEKEQFKIGATNSGTLGNIKSTSKFYNMYSSSQTRLKVEASAAKAARNPNAKLPIVRMNTMN